jgi:hypothetical protein
MAIDERLTPVEQQTADLVDALKRPATCIR